MTTRRERVVLELEDNFTGPMAKAAAATALLDAEMKRLGGHTSSTHAPLSQADSDVQKVGKSSRTSGAEVDKLSGRLRIVADAAAILGPALAPIGASAVPMFAAFNTELGFTAAALGTTLLAFQNVGDALKAMQAYQLQPTAENLAKLQVQMSQLAPAAQQFVEHLNKMIPIARELQGTAQAGLFPGLTQGLDAFVVRAPEVQRIIGTISQTLGELAKEGGESLSGAEWDSFFAAVEHQAKPALVDLGKSIGSVTHGVAELWQAFLPLSNDFSGGMVKMAADFDHWATGLSQTNGFHEFIAYVETEGPKVLDLVGALGDALIAIAKAASPLGGPVLDTLTALARALASIANSDLGTPIFTALSAMALYQRSLQLTTKLQEAAFGTKLLGGINTTATGLGSLAGNVRKMRGEYQGLGATQATLLSGFSNTTQAAHETRTTLAGFGKSAAVVAALGLVASGTANKIGLMNTASLGLTGFAMGGPVGAALGAGAGLMLDLSAATKNMDQAIAAANASMASGDIDRMVASLKNLDAQLADLNHHTGVLDALGDGVKNSFGGNLASKAEFVPVVGAWIAGLGGAKTATDRATAAQAKLRDRLDSLTGSQRLAAAAAGRFGAAQQQAARQTLAAQQAAGTTAAKFITLGKDVDNVKVSLDGWIHQLAAEAQALTDFGNNAKRAGDKGLRDGLIQQLEQLGPQGAMRMQQLANASQSEIAKANRAWDAGQAAIESYKHAVAGVPRSAATTLQLREDAAAAAIARVKAQLASIPRSISTEYYVNQVNAINKGHVTHKADGGQVFGPGGPRDDLIPARLSNREYVMPVDAVDYYGVGFMDDVRTRRFADGGLAGDPNDLQTLIDAGYVKSPSTGSKGSRGSKSGTKKGSTSASSQAAAVKRAQRAAAAAAKRRAAAAKAWNTALSNAKYSFNLTGDMTVTQANKEIAAFVHTIHDHGGTLGAGLKKLSERVDTTVGHLQTINQRLDTVRQERSSVVDTTTSAFTHDIFGGSQSDLITQLTADRNDANSMNRAIAAAKKKGLSGEFAAYLEQSGNINLAQQIAGDSGAQIKSIEDLYASRGSSVAATAKQAGNFFVPEIKTLTTQQAKLDHTLNHLESAIEDLAHRVESGAAKGTAKGSEKGTSHNRARAAATRRAGRA